MPTSPILGSGRTRGLSGDAQRVPLTGAGVAVFAPYLRRHHTSDDVVLQPASLWDGPATGGHRVGVRRHLVEETERGGDPYTDVLVVISQPDWRRAAQVHGPEWALHVRQLLRERCRAWLLASGQRPPQRPYGFEVVADGSERLGGEDLGLRAGDSVTGLLPNVHLGDQTTASPLFDVLTFAPGTPGWATSGTLYDDQALLTLGNHWLDNGRIEQLPSAAFYQLSRSASGELRHRLHPEFTRSWTLETRSNHDGQPVLALLDERRRPALYVAVCPTRDHPGAALSVLDEVTLQDGQPRHEVLERIRTVDEPDRGTGDPDDTLPLLGPLRGVEPTSVETRTFSLTEVGALLQVVHFARFMEGYDVALGSGGEVAGRLPDPVAEIQVRGSQASLHALTFGLRLDDKALDAGDRVHLDGDHDLHLGLVTLRLRDLRSERVEGWPYLYEIRRTAGVLHGVFGGRLRVGRSRKCRVRLPDDPWNGNIAWRAGMTDDSDIVARYGALPRERFYLDAIMVAAEHAEIDLTREPVLHPLSKGCPTFVRRGEMVLALPPLRRVPAGQRPPNLDLHPGDEILVGNCVLAVDYPPASGPRPVGVAGRDVGPLRATDLAASVSIDDEILGRRPLPVVRKATGAGELPAAAGLGERGPRPPRPPFDPALSEDSLEIPRPPSVRAAVAASAATPADRPEAPPDTSRIAAPRVVSDARIGVEVSRRARLVHAGWRLPPGARRVLGTHEGADLIVPVLQGADGRAAPALDLVEIHHEPDSVAIRSLAPGLTSVRVAPPGSTSATRLSLRLPDADDPGGEPALTLTIGLDRVGNGALFLRILPQRDRTDDRLQRGMLTIGLPIHTSRTCTLGRSQVEVELRDHAVEATWDGGRRALGSWERLVIDEAVYTVEIDDER